MTVFNTSLPGLTDREAGLLNSQPDCSHNGLALTKQKTFLLACTDEHGAILELDIKGKQLRRWDADDKGSKFDGGINDVVVTEAKESRLRSRAENSPGRCARTCKAWPISREPVRVNRSNSESHPATALWNGSWFQRWASSPPKRHQHAFPDSPKALRARRNISSEALRVT